MHRTVSLLVRVLLASACLGLFVPSVAHAKKKKGGTPAASSGSGSVMPPQEQPGLAAEKMKLELTEATTQVKDAQDALDAYVADQLDTYKKSDAVAPLVKAVSDDQGAFDGLKTPLFAALKENDSRYAGALTDLPEQQKKLDAAVAAKNGDEIVFRKSEVERLTGITNKAEGDAINGNPACKAAKGKLDADNAKLGGALAMFPDFLNKSPDYASLKQALANANARLTAAQATADAQ